MMLFEVSKFVLKHPFDKEEQSWQMELASEAPSLAINNCSRRDIALLSSCSQAGGDPEGIPLKQGPHGKMSWLE